MASDVLRSNYDNYYVGLEFSNIDRKKIEEVIKT